MNPWGIVVIAVGAIIVWIGVRGTQGSLYADIFGHPYTPSGSGPMSATSFNLPAGSSIGTTGPNGVGQQGSAGLNVGGGVGIPPLSQGSGRPIPGGVGVPGSGASALQTMAL